jgi:cystathionine beta-lyase
MKYDFDKLTIRRGTNSVKWDECDEPDVIPLWVADMDFEVAPAIQKAVMERAGHPVFGYALVGEEYYAAVTDWFRRRHGWAIRREDILYTTGVVPAMSVALKVLTLPGERVLILSPDYNCFFSSIRNSGCEVSESILVADPASRRFVVDWEDFERRCADEKTSVFLLCNPHNPTGRVWTLEELQQMAVICHRHGVRIVSDEIHCELVMPGHRFVPMGMVDTEAVILNSASKSFNIAGLQIANIVCRDAATRRRLDRAININEVCDVNPFGPVATIAAYNDSKDWLDELNSYLWDNYQALCAFAAGHLPQWRVYPLEGTYLPWVDITATGQSAQAYADQLLHDARVWVNPGTLYGAQSGEGHIRLNIACPRSRLLTALERISRL